MARSQPGGDDHVANLVDRLLAADKRLQGVPQWREGNPGDMRIRWPLLVGSSVSEEAALHLTAFPESPELRFSGFIYLAPLPSFVGQRCPFSSRRKRHGAHREA